MLMTGGRGWSCLSSAWHVQAGERLPKKLLGISRRSLGEGPRVCYYIILFCSLGSYLGPIGI